MLLRRSWLRKPTSRCSVCSEPGKQKTENGSGGLPTVHFLLPGTASFRMHFCTNQKYDQMSLAGLGLGVAAGPGVRGLRPGFLVLDQLCGLLTPPPIRWRRTVRAALHLKALLTVVAAPSSSPDGSGRHQCSNAPSGHGGNVTTCVTGSGGFS